MIGPYESWFRRKNENTDTQAFIGMAVGDPTADSLPTIKEQMAGGASLGTGSSRVQAAMATVTKRMRDMKYQPVMVLSDGSQGLQQVVSSAAASATQALHSRQNSGLGSKARGAVKGIRSWHPIPQRRINQDFEADSLRDLPEGQSSEARLANVKDLVEGAIPDVVEKPFIVVGVIDDGLPFAHENFLASDGTTRIDHLWLQGSDPTGSRDGNVSFGKELTGQDIDDLRAMYGPAGGPVDEDALYADPHAGVLNNDPDTQRNIFNNYTHGAHVMEHACGFEARDLGLEYRDAVRIIGVQLPRTLLEDTSGFGKDTFVLAGVDFILHRALLIAIQLGRPVKVLVNVSLGATGGPKNGQHPLEVAVDERLAHYALLGAEEQLSFEAKVYYPVGNNFASQLAARAELNISETGAQFDVCVQPNDRTDSFVEFWMDIPEGVTNPVQMHDHLTFEVSPPRNHGGQLTMNVGSTLEQFRLGGTARSCQISVDFEGGRCRYLLALAPTEHDLAGGGVGETVPSGNWEVTFTSLQANGEFVIDGVIQRDEDPAGTSNGGRQCYFRAPDNSYHTHDATGRRIAQAGHTQRGPMCAISGFGSVNGWATSRHASITCVAGFTSTVLHNPGNVDGGQRVVAEPATYSAAHPRSAPQRLPDAAATTNRNYVLPGVLGSGTRSGSRQVLVGTSSAAPAILRNEVLQHFGLGSPLVGAPPGVMGVFPGRLGQVLLGTRKRPVGGYNGVEAVALF